MKLLSFTIRVEFVYLLEKEISQYLFGSVLPLKAEYTAGWGESL